MVKSELHLISFSQLGSVMSVPVMKADENVAYRRAEQVRRDLGILVLLARSGIFRRNVLKYEKPGLYILQ